MPHYKQGVMYVQLMDGPLDGLETFLLPAHVELGARFTFQCPFYAENVGWISIDEPIELAGGCSFPFHAPLVVYMIGAINLTEYDVSGCRGMIWAHSARLDFLAYLSNPQPSLGPHEDD